MYCAPTIYESIAFAATSVLRIRNTNKNRFFQWNKFTSDNKTKLVTKPYNYFIEPFIILKSNGSFYIYFYKFKYLTELQKLFAENKPNYNQTIHL